MSELTAGLRRASALLDEGLAAGRYSAAELVAATATQQARHTCGTFQRYRDLEQMLPGDEQTPLTDDALFDLASISKVFTAIVIMQLVEAGRLRLDDAVARHLAEFAAPATSMITIRQLLTHYSGLPWWLPLWSEYPDEAARRAAALAVRPDAEPGSRYCYSDLNLIVLGVLAERLTGEPLDVLVDQGIVEPLGLTDTGYRPDDHDRAVATEWSADTGRGMVRGVVHDENAWSLGGIAGHAGIFSTGSDLVRLGRCLLRGGDPVLGADAFAMMTSNASGPGDHVHGLGFEIDEPWFMGALSGPRTIGHTGFTGTSLVVALDPGLIVVLLTNRIHPTRDGGTINDLRAAVAGCFAGEASRGT